MNFISNILSTPLYIWLSVLLFLWRVIFFSASYGAVEHDSGWYLGVAKNLAARGIYASYTNTISGEGTGQHPSIHGRFSVQDSQGFSYFPAGVTVGPGYIVPQAILLKLFGNGWWQYRLWPLLSFTGLLLLSFFLVWKIGGFLSLFIFQIWLWVVPQLYTTYAYEAYAEHTALFYLLISFLLYYFATHKEKRYWFMFLSGLFLSLSFLTKNLFLLSGLGFVVPFFYEVWLFRKKIQVVLLKWGLLVSGFLLPIALFEAYRYVVLVSHFGLPAWHAINQDIRLTFQSSGSGISNLNFSDFDINWAYVLEKANVWIDVGINRSAVVWGILVLSPFIVMKIVNKQLRVLVSMLYASITIIFVWFLLVSPTGWARHVWQGIVLGMGITSVSLGIILQHALTYWKRNLVYIVLFTLFILTLVHYQSIELKPFLNQSTIEKWRENRYIRRLEGLPSTPILSFADQKDLIHYFTTNISEDDRVYYAGWFLNAEVSPLVDKVFYTLDRYFALGQKNPDGGKSYIIFGPYQQGQWSFMPPEYIPRKISELCEEVIYRSPSYILCMLKTGLVYNNPAYQ